MAERLLAIATSAYDAAPKLILNKDDPDPPPLSWHVAFTSGQFAEVMIRLLVLRNIQVTKLKHEIECIKAGKPVENVGIPEKSFERLLSKATDEAKRTMQAFGVQIAQEIA